jgi:SAM-dependent methyltransferase
MSITSHNIVYHTPNLADFYAANRCRWDELYPSERAVFETVAQDSGGLGRVLDVGCAAGGLALALAERFAFDEYVGVDINPQCVAASGTLLACLEQPARITCADVLDCPGLPLDAFDTVISLGCVDWNLESRRMIAACWQHVRPGGRFVLTLRLTPGPSVREMAESHQDIMFHGQEQEPSERAPYVVLNVQEALAELTSLTPKPATILARGYWGRPSPTAHTPYTRVVFAALALTKGHTEYAAQIPTETTLDCQLPVNVFLASKEESS